MLRHQQNRFHMNIPQQADEWQTLYEACQSNNVIVQNAAYQRLGKLLLPRARYCLYNTPRFQDEAADCVQDALVDIWKGLINHRGPTQQAQSFQSWCLTIVSRKVFDLLRRRTQRGEQTSIWDIDQYEYTKSDELNLEQKIVERTALCTVMGNLLNHPNLNAVQREVLRLQCIEDRNYVEIARRLNKSMSTIRVNRHRAIVTLQKDATLLLHVRAIMTDGDTNSHYIKER